MAKNPPDNPERRLPDADTANPHRDEPAPPPEEGLRPEADPAIVRPDEEEEHGPAEGLFKAAAAEVATEAPVEAPAAEAETAHLGIEEEGVESAQIFGLILATAVAIVLLVVSLYFLFYLPRLSQVESAAERVPAERYVELRETRAAAENLLGQYAVNPDAEGRYRTPIDAAMRQTVAAYGDRADVAPSPFPNRVSFNLAWANLTPAPAVASYAEPGAITVPGEELPAVEASTAPPAVEAPEAEVADPADGETAPAPEPAAPETAPTQEQ